MNTIANHKVQIKCEMIKRYGGRCMLTGKEETAPSKLTYHHNNIKNVVDPSKHNITVENGVILKEFIHCYFLHCVIERQGKECYEAIRLALNDYKEAIDNGDTEFIALYEELIFPTFREFQDNQRETKRRFRK